MDRSRPLLAILLAVSLAVTVQAAEWRDAAFCVTDPAAPWPWAEGNKKINEAKRKFPMAGATVLAHVRNSAAKPATLRELSWNGVSVEELAKSHRVVWWRLNPQQVAPGAVGEVAVRFRQPLDKAGRLRVALSNGVAAELHVQPADPPMRIGSICFSPDRLRVYLYVEKAREGEGGPPRTVLMDGRPAPGRLRWLSDGYVALLRVGVIELDQPLAEGSWHTWTVLRGDVAVSATLRVIADPVCFGTFGRATYSRFAENGLNGFYSFAAENLASLDEARSRGIRVAMYIRGGTPSAPTRAHPALFGYNVRDEPDVGDYSKDKTRPMHLRLGTLAPQIVREVQRCAALDPARPAMLTLNMTFMPANYYTYGQIADITTPDFYHLHAGWSLQSLRDAAMHAKRATAPRPFGFIYQGCWLQHAIAQKAWMGRDAILAKGFENFRDPKRTLGFDRKPEPAEIRIQMAYALGAGAKSLWSYVDATELMGTLLIRSSRDLPDVWREIGLMSRLLRQASRQISLSHPISWAKADAPKLWVRTLICGEDAALVVVVNEDYRCDREGFACRPAESVAVEFPDLPWLKAQRVEALTPAGGAAVKLRRRGNAAVWQIPSLADVALFRVGGEQAAH